MAKLVVAIVAEEAGPAETAWTRSFLEFLRPIGLEGRVLHLADPGFAAALDAALRDGVTFAWGRAGAGLNRGARNLWDAAWVPFLAVRDGAPSSLDSIPPTPYVVSLYRYREWVDLAREHVRPPRLAALLPRAVLPHPAGRLPPWARRPRRMVFAATGADPAGTRARWANWPARLQPVLYECADMLAARRPGPIAPILSACLAAHAMAWESCGGQWLGLLHELDAYSRALRATTIARALLPLEVDIVGAGWEHLRHEPGRARFSAMPASGFDALCAETRILVTATPNIGSGAPEGVLRGFAARCCVAADDNDFARDRLRRLPSYRGLEWQEPDLPDRLAALHEDLALAEEELDPAQAHVEARHDPASCLAGMLHLAQRARAQAASWDGVLDAA